MMSNEIQRYRLHPVMILIQTMTNLKAFALPIFILFISNLRDMSLNPQSDEFMWTLIVIGVFFFFICLLLTFSFFKWLKFIYWFEDEELRVEYGLFVKNKRYIPFERIQSLNYKESIFHRPFKLVKVEVETAATSSGEPEVELIAIKLMQADIIELEMKKVKQKHQMALHQDAETNEYDVAEKIVDEPRTLIYKMSTKDILILATTSSGVGLVFSALAAIASQFDQIIPYDKVIDSVQDFLKFGIFIVILIILVVLFISWGVSVVFTMINHFDYKVERDDKKLYISKGALEKKRMTVPINRIQGIRIVESPLRQPFNFVTVKLDSAGGGSEDDDKITLMPLIKKAEAIQHLQKLFPEFTFETAFIKPPKRAWWRYGLYYMYWLIIPVLIVSYFFYPYGLLSVIALPLAILLGIGSYKSAGIMVENLQLTIRTRFFNRVTTYTTKKRIQSMSIDQSYFERRNNLTSFNATIVSGELGDTVMLIYFERKDIEKIYEWFKPNK